MDNIRFNSVVRPVLVLAVLLVVSVGWAANTGQIGGKVTDKRTGEPLVGVNVLVEGTEAGGATDATGRYQIINIPPGKYTVSASYVGYNDQRITDVQVIQDLTATVD